LLPSEQTLNQHTSPALFVVLSIADQLWRWDPESREELPGDTGVLCRDKVSAGEGLARTRTQIPKVADRRGQNRQGHQTGSS
jgi:hypothetical protein